MANVVKKHSIASELAQKMVDAAVAKASELGVCENVAILDDGGNLKAFSRMDGAPILSIEIAQNKAYTALFGVSIAQPIDTNLNPASGETDGARWISGANIPVDGGSKR